MKRGDVRIRGRQSKCLISNSRGIVIHKVIHNLQKSLDDSYIVRNNYDVVTQEIWVLTNPEKSLAGVAIMQKLERRTGKNLRLVFAHYHETANVS